MKEIPTNKAAASANTEFPENTPTRQFRHRATTLTSIRKLQTVLGEIEDTTERALVGMQTGDNLKAGRALVALGICRQAREQVSVACQNMGITADSLMSIGETGTGASSEEQRRRLKEARIGAVKELIRKVRMPREAIFLGMNAFAEESATIAGIMVSRAEEHLNVRTRR